MSVDRTVPGGWQGGQPKVKWICPIDDCTHEVWSVRKPGPCRDHWWRLMDRANQRKSGAS